jgi:hypothetical protein
MAAKVPKFCWPCRCIDPALLLLLLLFAAGLWSQAFGSWPGFQPPGCQAGFCSSIGSHPGTLGSSSSQRRRSTAEAGRAAAVRVSRWCASFARCMLGSHWIHEGHGKDAHGVLLFRPCLLRFACTVRPFCCICKCGGTMHCESWRVW